MRRTAALIFGLLVLNFCHGIRKTIEPTNPIEDVDARRLEELIEQEEFLAVLFYTKECKDCHKILQELEKIDDDAENFGVQFVKNGEKFLAKKYGVSEFPALVYFRNKHPAIYDGDLMKEDAVLAWLTNIESMELPDAIEEVNAKVLESLIDETEYVAVLFYKNDAESEDVLRDLEEIDDDADKSGIAFVKISDEVLALEFGLETLPALLYYRNKVPLLYDDDSGSNTSQAITEELERIDDDCDQHGIPLVKIDDSQLESLYGIKNPPALAFYKKQVPKFYTGDLSNEEQVLNWLIEQMNVEEIEDVTSAVLQQMIKNTDFLSILFYSKNDERSKKVIKELENIDDEADERNLPFVKIADEELAKSYGIDDELPILVYFEKQIPSIFRGDLMNEEAVLEWLVHQMSSDEIEEVTDKLLDSMIKKHSQVAVLFYDASSDSAILNELEKIDDEADQQGIIFLKTSDLAAAEKFGIEYLPALVFFYEGMPNLYPGDVKDEDEVLEWLITQLTKDEIEDVTEKMLLYLVDSSPNLAALFYDEDASVSALVLKELENIDDELKEQGIPFVKISDYSLAKQFGLNDELPILVYFENKIPSVYEGDLTIEADVLEWLIKQKNEDSIEEVTEEILLSLVKDRGYVLSFFAPNDCTECETILKELENIDDELDKVGILLVTTDDMSVAVSKAKISQFPALVLFRNEEPVPYTGDLMDEGAILAWATSEETLDIPDAIEEVNSLMLENLLNTSHSVAVLFYSKLDCPLCETVLQRVEDIDDDAENNDIDFVKVSDPEVAEAYNVTHFPTLFLFKKDVLNEYKGDLTKANEILQWLIENRDRPDSFIEDVDRRELEVLIEERTIAVFFYDENCTTCDAILHELENIDDDSDRYDVQILKTNDTEFATELGVSTVPSFVYFEGMLPSIYDGDLMDENELLLWLIEQKTEDTIENINRDMLFRLIEEQEYLAIYFYRENDKLSKEILKHLEQIDDDCSDYKCSSPKNRGSMAKKYRVRNPPGLVFFRHGNPNVYPDDPDEEDCPECMETLADLENIDDDTDRHGILFVKTTDDSIAADYGITRFPALIYFENNVPSIYEGDISAEEEVLQWLIHSKSEDTIETVNRDMCDKLIENTPYLVVLFYKPQNKMSEKVLEELENIDGFTDEYGIQMVKTQDSSIARRYGVKQFPALIFFRNERPLVYKGDLLNEEAVLDWILSENTLELPDDIEEVNGKMLEKLVEKHQLIAVYFYEEECEVCLDILKDLEEIDEEANLFGVKFVKVKEPTAGVQWGVHSVPTLAYFRKGVPAFYEGSLSDPEGVLDWLTSQDMIELRNEIEEVSRKMLDKLLQENDFITIFFYDADCPACEEALHSLETIDDDIDELDILFVKIKDPRYARKYGVKNLPSLTYFRKRFPAIYHGNLTDTNEVVNWLKKNRYRTRELNLFMFSIIAMGAVFVQYTCFLKFLFEPMVEKQS
ncbi:putative protein disulfide-isomerase A4 like protein [Argiope bruennichi]|uniref:Thioredoxin domain-containing protein n=1 Tax=Argiope bruennichi TaxID=94029 RepID=A0A8T0E755_ARGBR|nr:putative protein disulfide-isomerase A4 like protein [Argiope bruennichi]